MDRQGRIVGDTQITWDGDDDDGFTLDPTGLGGIDLTRGGTLTGFYLLLPENNLGVESLAIGVYSDASNASTVFFPIETVPNGHDPADEVREYTVAFSAFATTKGAGADFRSVGAIFLNFTGKAGGGPYISLFQTMAIG